MVAGTDTNILKIGLVNCQITGAGAKDLTNDLVNCRWQQQRPRIQPSLWETAQMAGAETRNPTINLLNCADGRRRHQYIENQFS